MITTVSADFSQYHTGTIVTCSDGRKYQTIDASTAVPYVRPPMKYYAGAKGKPNRRVLFTDSRGTYHATKGWRR